MLKHFFCSVMLTIRCLNIGTERGMSSLRNTCPSFNRISTLPTWAGSAENRSATVIFPSRTEVISSEQAELSLTCSGATTGIHGPGIVSVHFYWTTWFTFSSEEKYFHFSGTTMGVTVVLCFCSFKTFIALGNRPAFVTVITYHRRLIECYFRF